MKKQRGGNRFINALGFLSEQFAIIALIAMTLLVLIQIFLRNVLNIGLTWGGELTAYFHIWMIFLGAALVFKEKGHVQLDLLVEKAPRFIRRVIDLFNLLVMIAFMALFLYCCVDIVLQLPNVKTPALKMPYWLFFLPAFLGFLFMMIMAVRNLFIRLRDGGEEAQ